MPFKQQQRDKAESPEPVTGDFMTPAPKGFHPEPLDREPASREPCALSLAGQALWIVCIAQFFIVGNGPAGLPGPWSVVGDKGTAVYWVFAGTMVVEGSSWRCMKPGAPSPFGSPEPQT